MAVAYTQQATNHDLEKAETKMKKPYGYGDTGHYDGYGSYSSYGGT